MLPSVLNANTRSSTGRTRNNPEIPVELYELIDLCAEIELTNGSPITPRTASRQSPSTEELAHA